MKRRLTKNEPRCLRRHKMTHACLEWGLGGQATTLGPRGRNIGPTTLAGVMHGTFCEKKLAAKKRFDRRSFRWKKSGKAWLLIGCPKGSWKAKKQVCAVGTRAYALLSPTGGSCPAHERRIRKG